MRTPKYGASNRKLVNKAINSKNTRYECPQCHKLKVKRESNAVWTCKSCGAKLAGGAYALRTEAGEIALRNISEYSS